MRQPLSYVHPDAKIAENVVIEPFTTIAARGGVTKSLKSNKTYAGFPAIEHKNWLKLQAKLSKLSKN